MPPRTIRKTLLIVCQVVGRSLWAFICDDATEALYKGLLQNIRKEKKPISFHYRCDSPRIMRFMFMEIVPLEHSGEVEFRNTLVRTEERNPLHFFKRMYYGAGPMLLMCSVCNCVRQGGEWKEVAAAFEDGLLDGLERPFRVAYGVCPECKENFSLMSDKLYVG